MNITTDVHIIHGEYERHYENFIVELGKQCLLSMLTSRSIQSTFLSNNQDRPWFVTSYSAIGTISKLKVGSNTTMKTERETTDLTTPHIWKRDIAIQHAYINDVNMQGVTFVFTAHPDSLDDGVIIGEMGLFVNLIKTTSFFQNITAALRGEGMFSRLAQADGEFTSFTYNSYLPLTINWNIIFKFE